MIEFKAACGHTIRANDDDAGGVIQCSYCGREAEVPHSFDDNDGLDFLYADVEPGSASAPVNPPVRRKAKRRLFGRKHKGPTETSPFTVVLYMGYAAVLFVIVVIVGKEFVLPLFEKGGVSRRLTNAPVRQEEPEKKSDTTGRVVRETKTTSRPRVPGLIRGGSCAGIYFSSIPPRADVFLIKTEDAPISGSIRDLPETMRTVAGGQWETKWKGDYVVEVSLPWSHKELMNPTLPFSTEYLNFRRAIHRADDDERRILVEDFFLPDEAYETFIHETSPDQLEIVRQYHNIRVESGSLATVRALFLPRIKSEEQVGFRVDRLLDHYLPGVPSYGFDKEYVRRELGFWGVPDSDQPAIITALERIGLMPFDTGEGTARLFMVGVCDGQVTTKEYVDRS